MSAPSFLANPDLRLLLFGGKGGVGKTTCSVATALFLARRSPERRFVLLSTDPAHSLKDSLANRRVPSGMEVVEFDAQSSLADFRRRHGEHLLTIADRGTFLDREDIRRFLSLSLPGMDELLGFLDIARRAESGNQDERLIVDTAPSGHTLRLLAMPELLRRWVDVLDTLLAKHRYMKQLFARAYSPDEIDRFLDDFSASVGRAEALLKDPRRCRFVPVMIAEELSVRETAALLDELDRLDIPAHEIVVNMLSPVDRCAVCAGMREQQMRALSRLPSEFRDRALWGTPLREQELRGANLDSFWDDAAPLDPHARPPALPPMPQMPLVEGPALLPPTTTRLLLFAGKGGTGKTTLACATALRLNRVWPRRKVLLFSTDPAHSLADCLGLAVGPQATRVAAGLWALEMDAQAELESLKQQYRQTLDAFFSRVLGSLDLPFDREVMERIIELSPPGLDEIMALTRAMDFLSAATYDLLVLDSAPTGHFIRLLEMPQLVDDWLKAFFELFLKYREVFGTPQLADRMVQISKDLRRFRALLGDPAQSAVAAASIPTRMALEETTDLFASCRRMGVEVAVLFLNMMTPESGCPFCAQRARQDREVVREYARSLPVHRTLVFRQPEPRGLDRLKKVGDALYLGGAPKGGTLDARASP